MIICVFMVNKHQNSVLVFIGMVLVFVVESCQGDKMIYRA
jgi:hypothetical protein